MTATTKEIDAMSETGVCLVLRDMQYRVILNPDREQAVMEYEALRFAIKELSEEKKWLL